MCTKGCPGSSEPQTETSQTLRQVYTVLCNVSLRASEVTRRAARALNNKKNIMLTEVTVRSMAENIAESIAFTYIHWTLVITRFNITRIWL